MWGDYSPRRIVLVEDSEGGRLHLFNVLIRSGRERGRERGLWGRIYSIDPGKSEPSRFLVDARDNARDSSQGTRFPREIVTSTLIPGQQHLGHRSRRVDADGQLARLGWCETRSPKSSGKRTSVPSIRLDDRAGANLIERKREVVLPIDRDLSDARR